MKVVEIEHLTKLLERGASMKIPHRAHALGTVMAAVPMAQSDVPQEFQVFAGRLLVHKISHPVEPIV